MSDVILISTKHGGMGHNFIIGLILGLYLDDPSILEVDKELGHAHNVYSKHYWKFLDVPQPPGPHVLTFAEIKLRSEFDNLPLILNVPFSNSDFRQVHQSLLLREDLRYRTVNHVIMTCTRDERIVASTNHWYKNLRFQPRKSLPELWKLYDELVAAGKISSRIISTLTQLTNIESQLMIEALSLIDVGNENIDNAVRGNSSIRFHEIKFGDVMNNRENILLALEYVTNKKRNNSVLNFYNDYINAQLSFQKKYFPKEILQ